MAFDFYYDHSLEKLADMFAENVYSRKAENCSAAGLLRSHTVVVQTRGMAEYLRQYLANKCAVAANLKMPFLSSFVNSILTLLYGDEFKDASLRSDPEHMRWLIMQILCDEKYVQDNLPILAEYASGDNAALKRWQISGAIAGVFDHYQLYRSNDKIAEMFAQVPLSSNWQKLLYEKIFNSSTPGRDYFFKRFAEQELDNNQLLTLPEEVTVFGIGSMPPEYLDFFVNLSRYSRIRFFYLTPCMEYWENQLSRREIKKPSAWEVAEAGNPLLQNLGRQGRSFFSCMMNYEAVSNRMEPSGIGGPDDYPPGSSMLEIMQYDIRYLFDRRQIENKKDADFTGQPRTDLQKDRSIAIHNCHSLRRELEVLHDELLKIIQHGTDPGNIIVMAPDIAACAPVIHAVFGNGELADVYSIADMPNPEYDMALTTFKSIINTANSRFEYSAVMTLLDLPLITAALGFSNTELVKFGELVYNAGARWGFDGNMRRKFCNSSFDEFSWQQAIDRLLAGFANRTANGTEPAIAGGSKVVDALENSDIESFAKMVNMLEKLEVLSRQLAVAKDIAAWCTLFEKIIDDFLSSSNSERTALAPLRIAARKLRSAAYKGFAPGVYPLNAALQMLEDHISNSSENGRFLRGKITFCRMMPMRSIPMDTVAILELNEGNYPRQQTNPGFDLMPLLPHPGDRSLTAQDRYLLLEALMAARKNLLFFYQGQNPRDGEAMPPCAPLSEIMDYLANAFELKEYKHKVSGISETYFSATAEHPSLNRENFLALQHLQEQQPDNLSAASQTADIASLYQGWEINGDVTIQQLTDFFANPCKWFLKNQFDLAYRSESDAGSSDDELWGLGPLDKYYLNNMLMNMRNNCIADSNIYIHAGKSNLLPPGKSGKKEFDCAAGKLPALPEFWQTALKNMEHLPAVYRSANKNYTISGMVNMSCDQKYVLVFNWSSYKSRHALHALLGALTVSAAAAEENRSVEVGAKLLNLDSQNGFEFRKISPLKTADAIKLLDELIELAGEEHHGPLPLFEKSSVYYQDPAAAKSKFVSYSDFCEVNQAEVKPFFTGDMWDQEDFSKEFNYYAAKLYSLIAGDEDL